MDTMIKIKPGIGLACLLAVFGFMSAAAPANTACCYHSAHYCHTTNTVKYVSYSGYYGGNANGQHIKYDDSHNYAFADLTRDQYITFYNNHTVSQWGATEVNVYVVAADQGTVVSCASGQLVCSYFNYGVPNGTPVAQVKHAAVSGGSTYCP